MKRRIGYKVTVLTSQPGLKIWQKKAESAFRVQLMIKSKINFLSGTNTMASRQSRISKSLFVSIVF